MAYSRSANKHDLQLWEGAPVSSALPHKFADTGFDVSTLDFRCGNCEQMLDNKNDVRGNVSSLITRTLDFDLVGKCPTCGCMTPFRLRLNSDRWCDWLHVESGRWLRFKVYAPGKAGVKDSLKDMLLAARDRFFPGARG